MPRIRRWIVGSGFAISFLAAPVVSQMVAAQTAESGSFTATQPCPATRSINGANPGNIQLEVGQTYRAFGFNRPKGPYVWLQVPGAIPDRRWVAATCGTFQPGEVPNPEPPVPSPIPTPVPTPPNQGFRLFPFFDTQNNPVPVNFPPGASKDISPPPPKLEPFDQRILKLCGPGFDAAVDPAQFRQLLRDYPDVLRRLKQVTGGELKPGRSSDAQFTEDVTAIWFDQKGFKHIFCGEQDGKSIGGLHFVGRYLELQQAGVGGRIDRTSDGRQATEEVVDGSIYTFGAAIVQGNRVIAENPIKGYGYASNALELLLDGTKAFKLFKATGDQGSVACLYTVQDPNVPPFEAVFVKKYNAVRTFYPDATPDTRRTPPCDQ